MGHLPNEHQPKFVGAVDLCNEVSAVPARAGKPNASESLDIDVFVEFLRRTANTFAVFDLGSRRKKPTRGS
jgi:hypothetical protein